MNTLLTDYTNMDQYELDAIGEDTSPRIEHHEIGTAEEVVIPEGTLLLGNADLVSE